MTDKATAHLLRGMLDRVMTPSEALRGSEDMPARDFAGLISRLTQEIDETVLPRTFALCSEAGTEATVVVSNRRLIELKIGENKIELDAERYRDAGAVAREYAKAIKALFLRSGPMRVRPAGRAPAIMAHGTTCTASHISQIGHQPSFENRLKTFLKMSHAQCLGWIYQSGDGRILTHGSDGEVTNRLQSLRDIVLSKAANRKTACRIETACPSCSAFAITQDVQVLIAEDGNDRIFAAFPNSGVFKAISTWRQVFQASER
jgi:hypothetical protein